MDIDEKQYKDLFDKNINLYAANNQFGVSKIPYHIHNGADSPLVYKTTFPGSVQLSSGVAVINNPYVYLNSIIIYSYGVVGATIGILYISNIDIGTFSITSKKTDNSGTQTTDTSYINYLIINP